MVVENVGSNPSVPTKKYMGLWCSWLNIPLLQSGDEKYNVGSNPTSPTKIPWSVYQLV
jgi:hypothetical protein